MEAGIELIQAPVVKVEYDGLKPEESILKIDGARLGQVMTEIGYPPSVLRPVVINGNDSLISQNWVLAEYDPESKKIRLNDKALKNEFRGHARYIMSEMTGETVENPEKEKNIIKKVVDKIILSKYFPPNWAYYMLKERQRPFMSGNTKRRNRYFEHYKEVDEEKQVRMRNFMEKQIERVAIKHFSWILAHEYEHRNDFLKKRAIIISLAVGAVTTGCSILSAFDRLIPSFPEDLKFIGGGGILLGLMFAAAKGRSLDEQASFDAGDRNFGKFMDCISLDPEIFAKEILGKEIKN